MKSYLLIITLSLFYTLSHSAGTKNEDNKGDKKNESSSKEYKLSGEDKEYKLSGEDKGNDKVEFNSALKLIKSKDYNKAITKLKTLVNSTSTDFSKADVYNELGFAHRKKNDFENAEKYYKKSLEINPNHLGALEYQGEMYFDLGQLNKAKKNLSKIKDLVGESNSSYKELERYILNNS